ncbi:MAG: hypothetical protein U0X92_15095 [Anaerolineales bacterium]
MGIAQQLRRALRPAGKTAQSILRWKRFSFGDAPPVFGNSKPKSGSHLLLQILNGFTRIMPYQYVEAEPIRTITKEGRRKTKEEIVGEQSTLKRGVIGWGYVEATKEMSSFCASRIESTTSSTATRETCSFRKSSSPPTCTKNTGCTTSTTHFPISASGSRSPSPALTATGLKMVSVVVGCYEGVFEWLNTPGVMCLRFEDLVNNRDATLNAMLDEVEKIGYKNPYLRR